MRTDGHQQSIRLKDVARVFRHAALIVLYSLTVVGQKQVRGAVTVCDLFRNPTKWEGMHVKVTGIATVTGFADRASFGLLIPNQGQTCKYPDSAHSNSSEPAQIWSTYPSHFQPNPPGNTKLNQDSAKRAFDSLRRLQERDPSLRHVLVTLDGFVLLRKYNLADVKRDTLAPIDPWTPVVFLVEAFDGVESRGNR